MIPMHFNYKDVFRAGRLGFSAKKIWIGFVGLLIGIIVYSILSHIAFLASGWKFQEIWRAYRYIPIPYPLDAVHLSWWGWIIWAIGGLLFSFILLITVATIAKVTFEQLRGDEFYEAKEAARFALKNWKGVFLSPITLLVFIGVILFIGFVFGVWGRIPYFGQLFTGIFAIPIFAGALFCVYLMVVTAVSLVMAPAIVATTESDTFDTLFETFSVINDQPWRFILWETLLKAIEAVGVFLLAWFAKKALLLTDWALRLWQGPRGWMSMIWGNGCWYLPACPPIPALERICARFLPTLISPPQQALLGTWADKWGGFFLGLSFYFIGFFVVAFGIAIWGAGQALIYTVLVKIKDDRNLLEKREEIVREERVEETPKEESVPASEEKKPRRKMRKKSSAGTKGEETREKEEE